MENNFLFECKMEFIRNEKKICFCYTKVRKICLLSNLESSMAHRSTPHTKRERRKFFTTIVRERKFKSRGNLDSFPNFFSQSSHN